MKSKYLFLLILSIFLSTTVRATTDTSSTEPKGQAVIQIFTNFHTGFGVKNHYRGFELDRSYLGYEYKLGHGLKVKGVMDIGKSSDVDDFQRIAYVKNAMISWKHKRLILNGGLISTTQFGLQDMFWGNRYIMKSFQDDYGFGSSGDLGLSVSYMFTDWLTADAIVVNGEGYKKVQINDGLAYGVGVTLKPLESLTLRVYGALNESADKKAKDCYNLATFIGYKHPRFSLACEYNRIENAKYLSDNNMDGVSAYGTLKVSKLISVFGRYDQLFVHDGGKKDKEEYKLVGGLELKLGNYIKLAPNFRYHHPTDTNRKDYWMAYINCYFGI